MPRHKGDNETATIHGSVTGSGRVLHGAPNLGTVDVDDHAVPQFACKKGGDAATAASLAPAWQPGRLFTLYSAGASPSASWLA